MKLSEHQVLEVYPPLMAIAYKILKSTLSLFHDEARDLAHGYVIHFLFESKSFLETYDEEKGKGIFPYFNSYMRKSVLSYSRKERRKYQLFDGDMHSVPCDESFLLFEFKDVLKTCYALLENVYVLHNGRPVSCRYVLKGIVHQVLNGDLRGAKVNRVKLCQRLGLKKVEADKAITRVREVLYGRL